MLKIYSDNKACTYPCKSVHLQSILFLIVSLVAVMQALFLTT